MRHVNGSADCLGIAQVPWERYYVGLTPADIALGSDDPVPMRAGSTIWTIGEAAEYARKLPKRVTDTALWQHGASDLLMAAISPTADFLL